MDIYEARQLARRLGCFVVVKPGLFLLYRQAEQRNEIVAKRGTLNGFAKLLRKMAKGLDEARPNG